MRTLLPAHAVEEAPRARSKALAAGRGALGPSRPVGGRAHIVGQEVIGSRQIEAVSTFANGHRRRAHLLLNHLPVASDHLGLGRVEEVPGAHGDALAARDRALTPRCPLRHFASGRRMILEF